MHGHFADLKQAYMMGMMEALRRYDIFLWCAVPGIQGTSFKELNYRERAIVADHLGFCREYYTTHYYDHDDLDEDGNPKRKPRRKVPFIELAAEHGLTFSDTADEIYRRALKKMQQKLSE